MLNKVNPSLSRLDNQNQNIIKHVGVGSKTKQQTEGTFTFHRVRFAGLDKPVIFFFHYD